MSVIELGSPPLVTPKRKGIVGTAVDFPEAFANEKILKHALSALQRGPIRFQRNNVIACEGDTADYMFLVITGVVRHCKTFRNRTRNIVAFYLPGDLFGSADADHNLSVEAAADAMVLFIKRSALFSIATRECRVANFLLATTTNELRRAQEHALLMSKDAKCRLATFLTDFWRRIGKPNCLDFPMTHQDIADHLGLTIETLSRTITNLERSGIIFANTASKFVVAAKSLIACAHDELRQCIDVSVPKLHPRTERRPRPMLASALAASLRRAT